MELQVVNELKTFCIKSLKKPVQAVIVLAFILLLAGSSCTKSGWFFFHDRGHDTEYTVTQFNIDYGLGVQMPYVFRKTFSGGKQLSEIDVYFYNYSGHVVHARLRPSHGNRLLYLVNSDNAADTAMTIYLGEKGRVEKTVATATIIRMPATLTTVYKYAGNRLDSIIYINDFQRIGYKCYYDWHGNITGILDRRSSTAQGLFYTYDYSRKVDEQLYADGIESEFDNTLNLLRYLDFFPELNPRHVRTEYRNGNEGGPYLLVRYLENHVIDDKGKLLSYDVKYAPGATESEGQATLWWKCK